MPFQLKCNQLCERKLVKHRFQCSLLEDDDDGSFSTKYGVNRLSILDEVPYFDVTLCLPHDIMHVILEGVLPRNCCRLLHHCIFVQHYFSLSLLNKAILNFQYGQHEKNSAPRPIDRDRVANMNDKLNQSGYSYTRPIYRVKIFVCFFSITDVATGTIAAIDDR